MKKTIIFSVVLLIGAMVWLGWNHYSTQQLHDEIAEHEVASIKLWGSQEREADSNEKQKIISWFNHITDIRKKNNLNGPTPASGIVIELNTTSKILILRSGDDFEVQSDGGAYWGRQSDLELLLEQLAL
ncbi:hypothetical protein ACFO9Q_01480 [Paenibacillus sp. GCM10023252]|uniref:hypothetical protein n=1 Tax=Paenibacillus sp. GCM10023252 TaxID=3252649 RepID=UPI00361A0F56